MLYQAPFKINSAETRVRRARARDTVKSDDNPQYVLFAVGEY